MSRLVFLDAGPLGLLSSPYGKPKAEGCRLWARGLALAGARLFIPEIADYEVRRELVRVGSAEGLRRLDLLQGAMSYAPLTTDAMRLAADLWARARREGKPTADPHALDADVILVSESGLKTRADAQRAFASGCQGILVGESLMRTGDIAAQVAELLDLSGPE